MLEPRVNGAYEIRGVYLAQHNEILQGSLHKLATTNIPHRRVYHPWGPYVGSAVCHFNLCKGAARRLFSRLYNIINNRASK
jgi:hypothetical protein